MSSKFRVQGSMLDPNNNGGGLPWIPWQRYVLVVAVDGQQAKCLGRFRRSESLRKKVLDLNCYKGLDAEIVDTKQKVPKNQSD